MTGRNSTRFRLGARELLLITLPARNRRWDVLTRAEREIAEAILAGASNSEIAATRGTASLTVANQVAAVYRKLGVASRFELVAHLARPDEG